MCPREAQDILVNIYFSPFSLRKKRLDAAVAHRGDCVGCWFNSGCVQSACKIAFEQDTEPHKVMQRALVKCNNKRVSKYIP